MKRITVKKGVKNSRITLPGIIIFGILAVGMFCTIGPAYSADTDITDADINRAVEIQLLLDPAIPYDQLDAATYKGIVTFKGEVNNILVKDRVRYIASAIKGVRGIVNQITVKKSTRSDAQIQESVESAWLNDPAADSYELSAAVDDGVVTVKGTVQSWAEQQISLNVTKGVKGVREVKNDIKINSRPNRPDAEMQEDISSRLRYDVLVDDLLIKVSVEDSKAVLSGKVGSLAEKNRAIRDAWVIGITQVEADPLEIVWWARDEMRRKDTALYKSDKQIRSAVQDALLIDPRVYAFNPQVTVQNGVVYLNGVVDNFRAKKAAENDSRNVAGVIRVKNLLKVRPTAIPSASTLKKRVETTLELSPVVETDIDVRVNSGRVYLYGHVDNWYERYRAGRVVETVTGVIHVENLLTYPDRIIFKSDPELVGDIEDELFWSPFVDENQVQVTASNGTVTLSGQVDSRMERDAAQDNAYEAGAKYVINLLRVTSDRFYRQQERMIMEPSNGWRQQWNPNIP